MYVYHKWCLGLMSILLIGLSGCVGPLSLQGSRDAYNMAVQRTDNKELLLNLVRSRYSEPLQFLHIGAINTSFNYQASAGTQISLPVGGGLPDSYGVSGNLAYTEVPTITYQPLEGTQFAKQTQTEMPLDELVLLARSGWAIDHLMRLVVERIGTLRNVPSLPDYERFIELVHIWRDIQRNGDFNFIRLIPAEFSLVTQIDPELKKVTSSVLLLRIDYPSQAVADKADAILGIEPLHIKTSDDKILVALRLIDPLDALIPPARKKVITPLPIWLRSFEGILGYAALGVDVPSHNQHLVKGYTKPSGKPLNPRVALQDMIHIQSTQPEQTFLSVKYRGHTFYIDDSDHASKDTFRLLSILYALQSDAASSIPLLTIPVGGGRGG